MELFVMNHLLTMKIMMIRYEFEIYTVFTQFLNSSVFLHFFFFMVTSGYIPGGWLFAMMVIYFYLGSW